MHLVLLLFTIKFIKKKFIPLYQQFNSNNQEEHFLF